MLLSVNAFNLAFTVYIFLVIIEQTHNNILKYFVGHLWFIKLVSKDGLTFEKCTCSNKIGEEPRGPSGSHDFGHVYTTHLAYSASMMNCLQISSDRKIRIGWFTPGHAYLACLT